jgi:hypothetical protein
MPLDPRIEAIREKFGLEREDFWELPQKKGTWIAKHSALEVAAVKADIQFDNPIIIEANSEAGIAALSVAGVMGNRREWATGEAGPKNNKNAYPWAMAEKRAKDRVILKLIGIHGLVYSEDEGDFREPAREDYTPPPPNPEALSKAKTRDLWGEMRDELDACSTVEQLGVLWMSRAYQDSFKTLPADWQKLLVEHKDGCKARLDAAGIPKVSPNFDALEQALGAK